MDDYTIDQLLVWYERLEEGVLTFAKHVPMTEGNEALEAPILVSYLLDACGLLDSLFRDMTPSSVVIEDETIAKKDCTIKQFATLHSSKLDLPNCRSIMLVTPPRYRQPFSPWRGMMSSYVDLPWWSSHNKLKHDRLANIKLSNLGATLDALCALQQVIVRRLDHIPQMIRRGWFPRAEWPIDHIIEESKEGRLPDLFIVQTKLFATPVGSHQISKPDELQFPVMLSDLKLSHFKADDRFYRFMGSTG